MIAEQPRQPRQPMHANVCKWGAECRSVKCKYVHQLKDQIDTIITKRSMRSIICKNVQTHGSCHHGDNCYYKASHPDIKDDAKNSSILEENDTTSSDPQASPIQITPISSHPPTETASLQEIQTPAETASLQEIQTPAENRSLADSKPLTEWLGSLSTSSNTSTTKAWGSTRKKLQF
jgi:hypothetical protein